MAHSKEKVTYEDLEKCIKTYITDKDELENIHKAYLFAFEKHEGQIRKSGEPYIIHPLCVAKILTEIYADAETLEAGLLHDVLEDCNCTYEEMEHEFGPVVTKIVDGVTKISRLHFSTDNEYQVEYTKKIIVGMSEDVRVIIVKLADRLHNMRTLWALPVEKQKRKAKESLEILAPIAHHLGIHKIKSELEDLSLRYLKPDVYYDIAARLNSTKNERDKEVNKMMNAVKMLLDSQNIKYEMKGRAKSIYSIYNKLNKGKTFNEIYDYLAMRILVDTKQECYLVLGLIHSKFKPMQNRFKDYIANPKPNMYQSLHTTVFGVDGYIFEVQIRTHIMDEIAENGIASHWAYKEHKDLKGGINSSEEKLQFFKNIIDLKSDNLSSEEFVNSVKNEVLNNNIYCYTPKGDVYELPAGATPIDFAYHVHTHVGETTTGAIVNGEIKPLDYELKNNDVVKIITNKSSHPSKEWVNIVKSTAVRNKIKAYFTRSEKENNILKGKDLIEKELRKRKIPINDFLTDDNIKKICKETKVEKLDDIYLEVGNGKHSPKTIINFIYKDEEESDKPKKTIIYKNSDTNVVVSGLEDIKVNLASCCHPVYGDRIIGYITKGNGITVHRTSCHNVIDVKERLIDCSWSENNDNVKYITDIVIYSNDDKDNMIKILEDAGALNVGVKSVRKIYQEEKVNYELECYVTSKKQIDNLITSLRNEPFIDDAERIIH